jgi:hypothetical protein
MGEMAETGTILTAPETPARSVTAVGAVVVEM